MYTTYGCVFMSAVVSDTVPRADERPRGFKTRLVNKRVPDVLCGSRQDLTVRYMAIEDLTAVYPGVDVAPKWRYEAQIALEWEGVGSERTDLVQEGNHTVRVHLKTCMKCLMADLLFHIELKLN